MGAIANLVDEGKKVVFGNDSIVIRHYGAAILGGRTLDVTAFADAKVIEAGHIIIYEPATNTFKPLPVSSGAYTALPQNHEYAGVLMATVTTKEPFASIMYDGEVNDKACPFEVTASLKAALKTALPKLVFMHD